MKKKQVIALLVFASVLALGATACGKSDTETGGTETSVTEGAGSDVAAASPETENSDVSDGGYSADMFNETDGQAGGGPGGPGGEKVVINNDEITAVENGDYVSLYGLIGSWSSGGNNVDDAGTPIPEEDNDYLYTSAVAVVEGDTETYTNKSLVSEGTYDASSADGIVINDSESGHNGILLYNVGDYTISNADIKMETDADGLDTCDFSGVGAAVLASGDANVTISDSNISTAGVATMPIFADAGATTTIKNSTLVSKGGTLHGDYMNSPDQATMVAPPWILGIMGTSRTTNLMGDDSTMNLIDSDTSAGAWAVLSTDSGSNMYLNMFNTDLTLLNADESAAAPLQQPSASTGVDSQIKETVDNPYSVNYGSGYGTYAIGNAVETFAGATVNVGTYGTIFTGGSATFMSTVEGETYTLKSATGKTDVEYTSTESKNTVINSDTFGFMIHQSENKIDIKEGTEVNSGFATFLVKSGSSNETVTADVDGASVNNGGVLIQVMDNDDATTGGMMDADDPANLNGAGMNFKPLHTEAEGFNTADAKNDGTEQNFTFTNGEYSGNVYNASGSDNSEYGPLEATTLNLTIGSGATYSGAAASTAAIHVTYDGSVAAKAQGGFAYTDANKDDILSYQNTSFDMGHYFDIGQVANLINYNGGNDIHVTLTDDAVWNVTGESLITGISVSDGAKVVVEDGATLTVGETVFEAGTYGAGDF